MPESDGEHRHERAEDSHGPATREGPDFEGLLLRAAFNYHVFLAAAMGYSRERGADVDGYLRWTAERIAPTWSGLRGHGADAVLRLVLENLAATGYAVRLTSFGAEHSSAAVDAVPLGLDEEQWRDLLSPYGVTPNEMRAVFGIFQPLAEAAGARYTVEDRGASVEITVRREPARPGPQPIKLFN